METRIKNISNRELPVDGLKRKLAPGKIIKVELTPKIEYMIKNKFFEDLGLGEKEKAREDIVPPVGSDDTYHLNKKRKNKSSKKEMI